MKYCKACSAELEEDAQVCPQCGAAVTEEAQPEQTAEPQEVTVEEVSAEETPAEETVAEEPAKKKTPVGLIVALVLVVLLVVAVIVGKGQYDQSKDQPTAETPTVSDGEDTAPSASLLFGHHINAYGYGSYTVNYQVDENEVLTFSYRNEQGELVNLDDAQVEAMMDETVATCAGMTLTNRELQYYYEQQFYSFYSMYSGYLSYFMNTAQGLDEQLDFSGEGTWQQSFLDSAVEMFKQIAVLNQQGKAEGFTLTEEQQAQVDEAMDLSATAAQYGYDDVDAFMDDYMTPFATQESYLHYIETNLYANFYAQSLSEAIALTDAEVEAYYDENADLLQGSYGIAKTDKNVVNVRHILIQPESTTAEDGTSTITDEAWAAAEAQAQALYDQWLAGEATEDSFAQLATENTQDPGSQTTGGLYEDVYPGQMVTEFNDWCFADGRQIGDHGMVKTSYGYHIMFFSGEGDYVYWRMVAESQLRSTRASEDRSAMVAAVESQSDLTKAILLDSTVSTVPETTAE